MSTINAVFVSSLSVPAAIVFLDGPDWMQFAASSHLDDCRFDAADIDLPQSFACQAVALAGVCFTTYSVADMFLSLAHGLAGVDTVIHHVVFATAGMIMRGHCMLMFNAAMLMAMEVSTPFLNYFLLVRHRGETFAIEVIVFGSLFFLLYIVWRIGLNTYATVYLWTVHLKGSAIPAHVPQWQAWLAMMAVTAGAGVQLFWLPGICKNFMSKFDSLFKSADKAVEEVPEQPFLLGDDVVPAPPAG
jgi:hypothetical protein